MPVANERGGGSQIVVRLYDSEVQVFTLSESDVSIGRTPDNDLILASAQVSKRHAVLSLEKTGWVLTDLASSNGPFFADVQLLPHRPRLLVDGEIFQIGPFFLSYRASQLVTGSQEASLPENTKAQTQLSPSTTALPAGSLDLTRKPALPTWPSHDGHEVEQSDYIQYLPDIFQNNTFLERFLSIFECLWRPIEQRQNHIAMYFDPRTCPATLLPWLANWLDLDIELHWPESRVRVLLSTAMELHRWQGTRYGMTRVIELCTGFTPSIVETANAFVFRIILPANAGVSSNLNFIQKLIELHKPAHIGYELEVEQ
jgi:phage tail-like protein